MSFWVMRRPLPRLAQARVTFRLQQAVGVELYGREVHLGVVDFVLPNFSVIRDKPSEGIVRLRPIDDKTRDLVGYLHRGSLGDFAMPEGSDVLQE
jgi:hypothetical protein